MHCTDKKKIACTENDWSQSDINLKLIISKLKPICTISKGSFAFVCHLVFARVYAQSVFHKTPVKLAAMFR